MEQVQALSYHEIIDLKTRRLRVLPHRILLTRQIHPDAMDALARLGSVRLWPEPRPIPPNVLLAWIREADACLSMLTDRIDGKVLEAGAANLRIVSNMAVGFDNIDVSSASQKNILVTNTPDVLTEATAELTWALMLTTARRVISARESLLRGEWGDWAPDGFLGTELWGKTLGIVGWGRIGEAVARRASAFGMRVIVLENKSRGSKTDTLPLPEFLAQADVISLHVPLTPATRKMVDASWFQRMKPSAFVINTARGPVIDSAALLDALNAGHLAGAALDVFEQEPLPGDDPLATHPRVLATPHIGSATAETRRAMALRAVENIAAALSGRRPPDLVEPRGGGTA